MNTQNAMNTEQRIHTREQNLLIADFCSTYGLAPEQIRFYSDDPEPLFDRDAVAVLIDRLVEARAVSDDPVPSHFPDTVAIKYTITLPDGRTASSTGMANLNELLDGKPMTFEQVKSLATARGARGALRNKAIDLVKLHYSQRDTAGNVTQFSGEPINERQKLLREAHALGYETGLIFDDYEDKDGDRVKYANKDGWYRVLNARYGYAVASDLSDENLTDFTAFLRSQLPVAKTAA